MSQAEMFVDFKRLFKAYNRTRKRKLTTNQKKTLRFLIIQQFQMWTLSKALEMGNYTGPDTVRGAALVVEPLDVTMKLVTFDSKHLKLHKNLLKKKKKKIRRKTRGSK